MHTPISTETNRSSGLSNDHNGITTYKSTVRRRLKLWHAALQNARVWRKMLMEQAIGRRYLRIYWLCHPLPVIPHNPIYNSEKMDEIG